MKSVIVGTAGHIDHGKTALVKALTGIDADRLEEEKRRGITIDIRLCASGAGLRAARFLRPWLCRCSRTRRFVRNMLAGVGGIDLVLLVIAADESVKPQTASISISAACLRAPRIAVLTNPTWWNRETLDVVRLEVEEFLRHSFLDPAHSSVVAVSALTGAGLDDLKAALVEAAAEVHPRTRPPWPGFRLTAFFTMKGFGVVVTGTLVAGTIREEHELEFFCRQACACARVQVHDRLRASCGWPAHGFKSGRRNHFRNWRAACCWRRL